jgi:hypothetical protein
MGVNWNFAEGKPRGGWKQLPGAKVSGQLFISRFGSQLCREETLLLFESSVA